MSKWGYLKFNDNNEEMNIQLKFGDKFRSRWKWLLYAKKRPTKLNEK